MDPKNVFPRWLNEFRRFQRLKSQIYLHGNLYDSYYLPHNYLQATSEAELEFAGFSDVRRLLFHYLRSEGYDLLVYYDVIDGFDVQLAGEAVPGDDLLALLREAVPRLAEELSTAPFRSLAGLRAHPEDAATVFRALVATRRHLACGVINFASRFSANPGALDVHERRLYLRLLKAAQEAQVLPERGGARNLLVVLCDKLSDVPAWLLLDNPLTKGIELQKPDRTERGRFFDVQTREPARSPFHLEGEALQREETRKLFVDLSDGLTTRELENLAGVSRSERIHLNKVQRIVDLYKYGERESLWEKLPADRVARAGEKLKERVIGQDRAVAKAVQILRRARLGLHAIDQKRSNRPKGVLFFAGPTGTGKTELAKSLASFVFGDEDAIIRFDMSEYNDSHSDQKLIGAPPGYVGYEEGGQLTRKVREKPFSVVLFDEIEKAHPIVFDKFLQILDDGRLTDGKGETTYFGESLIVFTSNLGMFRQVEAGPGLVTRQANVGLEDTYDVMSKRIMEEIEGFFKTKLNRPEILNRFGDNFVVFDFIRREDGIDELILLKALKVIQRNLGEQKGIGLEWDDAFVQAFRRAFVWDNLINGGRGINNRVETHVKNGLASFLFDSGRASALHGLRLRLRVQGADRDDRGASVVFDVV